jgi:hypothetical protein
MPAVAWRITLAHRRSPMGGHRLVKLISLTEPDRQDFSKILPKGLVLPSRRRIGEPQTDHRGLASLDIDLIVCRHLRSRLFRIHRTLLSVHHVVVDAILEARARVWVVETEPGVVGFILGKKQRRRSPVLRFRGKIRVTLKVVAGNPYDVEPVRMTERQAVVSSSTKSRCPPS